jgi:hypothetical protein
MHKCIFIYTYKYIYIYIYIYQVLLAIGKPISITFLREKIKAIAAPKVSTSFLNRQPPPVVLSDQEKDARRLAMVNAAQNRGKVWDKKVAAGSRRRKEGGDQIDFTGKPIYDHSLLAEIGSANPETQRMVRMAKEAELKRVEALGYDPFKPHMSSSSTASGSAPEKGSTSPPNTYGASSTYGGPVQSAKDNSSSSGQDNNRSSNNISSNNSAVNSGKEISSPEYVISSEDLLQGEAFPDIVEAVDTAMGMLLSNPPEDGVKVQIALDTIESMLTKLAAANSDDYAKFKSIRVMNGGIYMYI